MSTWVYILPFHIKIVPCIHIIQIVFIVILGSIYKLSSDFRIETAKEFIKRKGWAKEGLGMQIHIYEPHEENVNWHTHAYIMYVVTTRRFVLYGKELGEKARDLQANNRGGKVHNHHEFNINILLRDIQNK